MAENYLTSYQENNFIASSNVLHCPASFTEIDIKKNRDSIANSLSIYSDELGKLKSYKVSKNDLYVTATTRCGEKSFWSKNKPKTQIVYETQNENNEIGYIIFSFSKIGGRFVLADSKHGLPILADNSVDKISRVYKRIARKTYNN